MFISSLLIVLLLSASAAANAAFAHLVLVTESMPAALRAPDALCNARTRFPNYCAVPTVTVIHNILSLGIIHIFVVMTESANFSSLRRDFSPVRRGAILTVHL